MSIPPSNPHGAPSLAEVLIKRTFAKPTQPFVDGEFLRALEQVDATDETAAVSQAASDADTDASSSSQDGASTRAGKIIDVRA